MPRRSTEAKNLDDDEWKINENLTQLNKVIEEQSQQSDRRAQPTAGENQKNRKSSANCRLTRTERTVSPRKKLDR